MLVAMWCLGGFFIVFVVVVFCVLAIGTSNRPAPVSAFFGGLGAGKSSWNVQEVLDIANLFEWTPVVSTVPVVLPKPYCLFLARHPGDYIAAAFTFSQWVFSEEAYRIRRAAVIRRRRAALARFRLAWLVQEERLVTESEIENIFRRMQKQYRRIAADIDWHNRTSIDTLVMAHNMRVLHNRLDAPLADLFEEAKAYEDADFYALAEHVWGRFRFRYSPPAFRYCILFDEVGVIAGADDNKQLKESAFYPFIAQARKLGAIIFATGHHPSRVQKQLREIVDRFCKVHSFELPWGLGRFYLVFGYPTEEKFEEGRGVRHFRFGRVTTDTMGCYATFWIVRNWGEVQDGSAPRRPRVKSVVEAEVVSVPAPTLVEEKPFPTVIWGDWG